MTNTELPAGYVDLGVAALHVAELRKYSTDVRRFMRMLPTALEMQKHKPGSPQWHAVVGQIDPRDMDNLELTLNEMGHLQIAMAEELDGAA